MREEGMLNINFPSERKWSVVVVVAMSAYDYRCGGEPQTPPAPGLCQ